DAARAAATSAEQAEPLREARNTYLTSMAGRLRGAGLRANEIRALLVTLNEVRYGGGRHAQGPLALEELERTIFKSVVRWEADGGLRANTLPEVDGLGDLLDRELPEPAWLVPGLLGEGLVLFAGKPKLGKSWLALSLALACAPSNDQSERVALGHYPVTAGGVLYLSLEDSEKRFQSRVRKLLGERPVPSSFGYALEWKPLLSGGLHDLETILCNAPDTRLVVIDTLARVRTPGSGSSIYQEDYALMAALHALVVRHHLTLILVHHTRKMASDDAFDEISGTTGLTGAVDTSMVLKRARGERDATLHLTGRDVEEQELALTFNPTTCAWTVTGNAAERQQSQSRQAILDLLAEYGTMAQKDIIQALDLPKGTIYSTLSRLTQEECIRKVGRGRYSLPTEKAQIPLEEKTEAPAQPVDVTKVQESQPSDDLDSDDGSSAADIGWPEYDDTDREEDNMEEYGWPEYDDDDFLRDEEG
ncbi:MAG TPA: AAA family ATPase, partial [Ktedonobacteraceae bacterium]|nr:AAA family ATPase [Ktedonobacteraceae bacterium]